MDIRRAAPADVPAILEIFRIAKAYMAAHGNAGQWGGDYPGLPELLPDIARGHSYVLTDGGVIVAAVNTEVPRRKNALARAADTRCEHVLCADFVRRHVYAAVLHVFSKCHYASSSVVSAAALLVLESA